MLKNDRPLKYRAWSSLAAATAINLTMGINYSWSVIKKSLVTDWHWTNVEASLPYTFYTAIYAFSTIFAGRAQDKFGPRRVAGAGSLVLGLGMIACIYSSTPLALTISYGAIASVGFSMCYATAVPTSLKWFPPEKRGRIAGIVVGATGMAAVYMSPIANWSIASHGIANTFLLLGIGIVVVSSIAARFLSNPPPGYEAGSTFAQAGGVTAPARLKPDYEWRQMLKTPTFYKLWLSFFFAASGGLMIFGHLATIAKTQANWEYGFYLVSLLALFNTIGRIASGICSDRFGPIFTLKIAFFLQALNLLLFFSYLTPSLLAVGTMVTGLCYGACFTIFPLITSDFYGLKNLGVNYGLMLSAWGCAGFLGPLLAGWAVDATGSYFLAYVVSATLLFAALIIAFATKPPAHANL
ncbi:MAG: OFA family MFS transporter [Negativicutes bacterium]|nr:OFA family MFS transporter [Negativicutes bacterium]